MSPYEQVRQLAQEQLEAAARGDLVSAAGRMDERAAVLVGAAPPTPADADTIREILTIDRELASAFRQRMIALRDQAASVHHGRVALGGYRSAPRPASTLLDITR